jgi:biotin carboxylase
MRLLLLMPTRTYRARAFLAAAARLGVEVTVGSEVEHVLSGLAPGATVALDFKRPSVGRSQILEFAREYPIEAVVGVDDDGTILAAMAAEALGLPQNSVESVKAARYKDVMRLILSETELNSPHFQLAGLDEDPAEVAGRVPYPCVLKPLSLSASRGVVRADDPAQFAAAFREIVAILGEADLDPDDPAARQLLVESYIPGAEYALEGLLVDGELTVLALFDKPDPLEGPYFEETIYLTPSRLPPDAQAAIAQAAARAAAALGLREGPLHAEARLNAQGPWILEVAARSIGGLCSDALRFADDTSLEEIILRQAARLDPASLRPDARPAGVMMIPIPRSGILHAVRGRAEARAVPGIEEVTISIPFGQEVVPLPRGNRYLGFIHARAATVEAVEAALREAHARLEFDIR